MVLVYPDLELLTTDNVLLRPLRVVFPDLSALWCVRSSLGDLAVAHDALELLRDGGADVHWGQLEQVAEARRGGTQGRRVAVTTQNFPWAQRALTETHKR